MLIKCKIFVQLRQIKKKFHSCRESKNALYPLVPLRLLRVLRGLSTFFLTAEGAE